MENIQAERSALSQREAGIMLAKRLSAEDMSNAIVVGISSEAIPIASAVSEALQLPLEIVLCKNLKNPGRNSKNIGSVTAHEMDIYDCPYDLPGDYVYHEITRLRHEIESETKFYYGSEVPARFLCRTVILVGDVLLSVETIRTCIKEIQRQKPLRIIVAIPFVKAQAASDLKGLCDEVVFVRLEQKMKDGNEFYDDLAIVSPEVIQKILKASKDACKVSMN